MLPTSDQGIGIFFAGVGIGILLILAGRAGWRHLSFFGLTFQRPREKTADEIERESEERKTITAVERRQMEVAFLRFSEAAVGIVPMVEATGPADRVLSAWFDVTAAAVAAGITLRPEDHYRVAIWADLGHPESFRLLGSANHNKNDPKMETLSKEGTIGGHAWRSKAGEYLCVDVTKDRRFKARSSLPRPYGSIFAIRVGEHGRAWGVMTIDAPRPAGFGQLELMVIRQFAKLVSAGAAVASVRYSPEPGRLTAGRAPGAARIVSPSGDRGADHLGGSDDQP